MKKIINCETGEIIERELNKAEKDQEKLDSAIIKAEKAEKAEKETQKEALLLRLGLTSEEAALLLS